MGTKNDFYCSVEDGVCLHVYDAAPRAWDEINLQIIDSPDLCTAWLNHAQAQELRDWLDGWLRGGNRDE